MTTTTAKPLSKKAQKEQERQEAIEHLRTLLKPGDTVYAVSRYVSTSGMIRRIDLFKMMPDGPLYLTYYAGLAIGYKSSDKGGLVIKGSGMDMGFHVVYELGRVLFPKGFKLPKGTRGRNGDKSGFDKDGGYALKQRWL